MLVGPVVILYLLCFYLIVPLLVLSKVPVAVYPFRGERLGLDLLNITRTLDAGLIHSPPSPGAYSRSHNITEIASNGSSGMGEASKDPQIVGSKDTQTKGRQIADTKDPQIVEPKNVTKTTEATKMAAPSCKEELCSEFLDKVSKRFFQRCNAKALGATKQPFQSAKCHFMSANGRGDPVGLVSVPGAGCTWLRGLLEKATGVCTGSIYCDIPLRRGGFAGEFIKTGSTLVVKTHTSDYQWIGVPVAKRNRDDGLYGSAVLLIRNPFDNFISEHNRLVALEQQSVMLRQDKVSKNRIGMLNRLRNDSSHVSVLSKDHFGENEKWDTFLYGIVPRWQKTIVKWFVESIDFRKPILVVRYEDLKNDNLAQVERILNFIHFPFAKEVIEKRLQEDYGVFRRSHSGEDGFEHYTPSQQEMVNLMLFETIGVLKEHKVENLFNLHEYLRT